MPRRGIRRFALEVIFLAGVAAALTVADLRTVVIVVLMVVAWVLVALLEWTAWLDEPHYGRGLPPRYYVPHVALPPPRPVEQYRGGGYPVLAPDDAPTFVESTQKWAAELDDWPVVEDAADDTVVVVPLPPPTHVLEETVAAGPAPDFEEEEHDDLQHAAVAAAALGAVADPVPAREQHPEPEPVRVREPLELVLEPRPRLIVVHHVDPLSVSSRRRFRFRRAVEEDVVEVLDGPAPDRTLPLRLRDQSKANVP